MKSRVASVQNFADKEVISELKKAIIEGGVQITDLFSAEDITGSEPAMKAKQTEFEHAKRVEKKLGEEREKVISLSKEKEDIEKKVADLNSKLSTTQVKGLFETSADTRKLTDKQKAYIQKNINTFKSEKDGDDLKVDFEKFLDKQIEDYAETAKLFGVKEEEEDKGAPSGDGKGDDLESPENNPLIPND